ncbi:uncharacterized protein Lrt [Euwallacea similis]|uniref:uncharacterized protein Lrt n=1 Tax=Euwallacea similis TaxID=1736056 RepID=UPI00344DA828
MWWLTLSLIWWCGTAAIPSPAPPPDGGRGTWHCPEITQQPVVECSCDMPHTLRCTGDKTALQIIARKLRSLGAASISLLDCTVQNVSVLSGPLLEGISLHGLVISSGEVRDVDSIAFEGLTSPLQALGLPNNQLTSVPTLALKSLPELDRLDLSGNRMKILEGASFKGLRNLSFIDISNNIITKISPNTFDNLPQLRILRLRANRISIPVITKVNPISTVEDLDMSENLLVGPLGPKTFPKMESLKDLQLSHNSLSSVKMGALQGLTNLTTLRLQHNLIDVIEDHAFIHLSTLVILDMAHNRIVAVSGASLAHLNYLQELDLRHNFLRALTADLVQPLKSLRVLKLDENDISIVAGDAMKPNTILKHLTLLENPLNCDCSLIEFSLWLANASIPAEDKATAICTTPPSLENALLMEITSDSLLCGEDEQESIMAPLSTPYRAKVNLQDFKYDGSAVRLSWRVEEGASPYTCDAIFIYEEEGPNEILLESFPIKCNSSEMMNPGVLEVTVPTSLQLQHKYRYCVALFGSDKSDDVSLILGCSDMIPLEANPSIIPPQGSFIALMPRVVTIQANLTSSGSLNLEVQIYPENEVKCELNVAILDQTTLLSQRKLPCEEPRYTFVDLVQGPYRVCANVLQPGTAIDLPKLKCVTVFKKDFHRFSGLDIAFVTIFTILCIMVIALIWGVRKMLLKPKLQTHQCFLPPDCDDNVQHNRSFQQLWERSSLFVTCCNYLANLSTTFADVNIEYGFYRPILPPPPLQNSVLIPSNWKLQGESERLQSWERQLNVNVEKQLEELKFILDKDILEDCGTKSDINYKIAILELKKEKMHSKVALGSPYLALDLPDMEELKLSEDLPTTNLKKGEEYVRKIKATLQNAAYKNEVFSSPDTSSSSRTKSNKSSIVELPY